MSYRSLEDDIKWLVIQAEIKVKLESRVSGTTDVFRIDDGKLLFIANVNTFGEVYGYYTGIERALDIGVDALVDHFTKRVADNYRKKP